MNAVLSQPIKVSHSEYKFTALEAKINKISLPLITAYLVLLVEVGKALLAVGMEVVF